MAHNTNALDALLREHHVHVGADDAFQRRARLLQALWREEKGHPIGEKANGEKLGSRLPLPWARDTYANFLTAGAREAVRRTLADKKAGGGQLIEEDRLFANLLSSQPLCFNLFGDLAFDLDAATRIFRTLWPERVASVTAIRFEHSPARGDERYTGDHSAFDVFVEHTTRGGGRGFIGIEVKYHEGLDVATSRHKPRYDEVADAMACFSSEHRPHLRNKPLEQIWRDHLLAGAMLEVDKTWESGLYVFLHAAGNERCVRAAARYAECLTDSRTFAALSLERLLDAIDPAPHADLLRDRYLAWEKIERLLAR